MGIKRRQRTAPFLHRNWITSINTVMGASISNPKDLDSYTDDENDVAPAQKRRCLSSDPFEIDHRLAPPDPPVLGALQIEILRILHKDSKKVRNGQNPDVPRDILNTSGSCRITIFDQSSSWPRVLFCESQICDIITYKNPVGPHRLARIKLPRPFHVPEQSILVNRRDDNAYDFCESYKLVVELEAANGKPWPPLDSNDFGLPAGEQEMLLDSPSRHWVMSSEFQRVFGRIKSLVSLTAGFHPERPSRQTDYVMDVDLRRLTGLQGPKTFEKGSKACINAVDTTTEVFTNGHFEPMVDEGVNGINGYHHEDSSNELEDELDGDQTPTRALRTREKNKVYNLKVLSDQAQGKERKRRGRPPQMTAIEGRVTYFFPANQPVCLDYFRCVCCGVYHQTMLQLQLHLQTMHSNFEVLLETTSQGPQFRLSHRVEPVLTPTKTYQLGRPVKPFNLSTFASGDESWITSRLGPDNNDQPIQSPVKKATLSRQASDRPQSQSSQTIQPAVVQITDEKILVPDINQPLFEPVSKRRLKPGEELPYPEPDDAWLLHKHRECLEDYVDMTDNEQEYIKRWDAFILKQRLTGSVFFQRAWLKFVRQEASWLIDVRERMIEFAKHSATLFTRNLLDDRAMDEAFKIVNETRRTVIPSKGDGKPNGVINGIDGQTKQSPRGAHVRKGANGCTVCHLPVVGPKLLICSNKVCKGLLTGIA